MSNNIETVYGGFNFRSRLEARWAVFFDSMNIKYFYELQGYDLENGVRFLPDFFLPEHDLWLEVKPIYEEESFMKVKLLAKIKAHVAVVFGDVWEYEHSAYFWRDGVLTAWTSISKALYLSQALCLLSERRIDWAYEQARSARFEFGQTPNSVTLRKGNV